MYIYIVYILYIYIYILYIYIYIYIYCLLNSFKYSRIIKKLILLCEKSTFFTFSLITFGIKMYKSVVLLILPLIGKAVH